MELPKNAVSLEDAIRWTKRWQLKELTSGVEIKAHMIPSKDAFDIFIMIKGLKITGVTTQLMTKEYLNFFW